MTHPFSVDFRALIAERCAGFPRISHEAEGLKRAAVVIALTNAEDGSAETALLLTRRATKLRAHAGQWALPGGRCDRGETPQQTALRELHEELGLNAGPQSVLGLLDDFVTRSGYAIAPVVAWLEDARALAPNPAEVASVHAIRIDHMGREGAVTFETIPESDRPVIRLKTGEGDIHAPTAAMVYQFLELAAGRVTRVADIEQPVFAWR
jgi:8-oxo-dGTP pyrophosphatase MutT (NUDIX family)